MTDRWLAAYPEPGMPVAPTAGTAPADSGWLHTITTWADYVPGQVWAGMLGVLLVASVVTTPIARRQAYKAGRRTAGHVSDADRRDRALFLAAMVPAVGFWLAVLAGSFRGLAAFGRDNLRWSDGWEFLVPFTLDGVAISFGFLAFRAVRKRRSPERANRVVWGAALASAAINFLHEVGLPAGSYLGGSYLALLSLFGMLIFHEFLDQFTEGTEWIRREFPVFKLRWLTWPTNTACAWVAWRNYPPAENTPTTVAAAVAHLDQVRAAKRARRRERDLDNARYDRRWWTRVAPWMRVRQLDAALAEQRRTLAAVRSEQHATTERVTVIEAERAAAVIEAERTAKQLAEVQAEREAEQQQVREAEQRAERARLDAAEQMRRMQTEHAEQLAAMQPDQRQRPERSTTTRTKPARAGGAANAPKLTDEEAVAAMLRAHRSADYEWSPREVHRITGAGFGRIPKLIAMVAEHHERQRAERSTGADRSSADDTKEESHGAEQRIAVNA